MAAAGWYPDPFGDPTRMRYWDGAAWTDHYHPYPEPVAQPAPARDLRRLAVIAVAGLIAGLAGELFALLAELNSWSLTNKLLDGFDPTYAQLRGAADWLDDAETVRAIGWVAGAIAFIPWFLCAYKNLPRLGRGEQRFAPGWAVGGWFVPLLNLVRPKLIADEIYRESRFGSGAGLGFLHWWWALLLGSGLVQRIGVTILDSADDVRIVSEQTFITVLEKGQKGFLIEVAGGGMAIVAAALAILFVVRVTVAQRDRAECGPAQWASLPTAGLTPVGRTTAGSAQTSQAPSGWQNPFGGG